jgi:regulator of protease activity HflC (stomatin/prohibitin superfamily)
VPSNLPGEKLMSENQITVYESYAGLLYENGAFTQLLTPGVYKLKRHWFDRTIRGIALVDLRERSITIKGQEILTSDKVAIRVSLLVYYRVKDPEAAIHNVASYEERIYEDVQLAARRFLASRTLDAILSDRNEISDAVRDDVKESASGYGVEIFRADVKDLVFPGNLREIMNQVLETERRAEAKLIQARKDAEALKIKNDAENIMAREKLEAERERIRMQAESDLERARLETQAGLEEARALAERPELLRLRELQTLERMARAGGRFVIGLGQEGFGTVLKEGDQ